MLASWEMAQDRMAQLRREAEGERFRASRRPRRRTRVTLRAAVARALAVDAPQAGVAAGGCRA